MPLGAACYHRWHRGTRRWWHPSSVCRLGELGVNRQTATSGALISVADVYHVVLPFGHRTAEVLFHTRHWRPGADYAGVAAERQSAPSPSTPERLAAELFILATTSVLKRSMRRRIPGPCCRRAGAPRAPCRGGQGGGHAAAEVAVDTRRSARSWGGRRRRRRTAGRWGRASHVR